MPLPPHPLWASILDRVEIDLLNLRARLDLHIASKTSPSSHSLHFESISDFRWFSEIPEPWNYAEITEIHSTRLSSGQLKVDIMLWDEDAGITITARRVLFDGEDAERFISDHKFAWSKFPEWRSGSTPPQ